MADLKSAPFGGAGSNPAGVLSFVVFSRFAGEASSILASGLFVCPVSILVLYSLRGLQHFFLSGARSGSKPRGPQFSCKAR